MIPFHTRIRDVIKGFATEGRHFFFLANEHRIVGLVAVVNLNSRQVKVYLFSLLSELEVRLSKFILDHVTGENELFNIDYGEQDVEIKSRYKSDEDNNVGLAFVEYLYLSNLIIIVTKKGLAPLLGYSNTKFKHDFHLMNELRHKVAHPNRSIITNVSSVDHLWNKIDHIEDALFRLRSYTGGI